MDASKLQEKTISSLAGGLAQLRHLASMKEGVPAELRPKIQECVAKTDEVVNILGNMNFTG